MKKQHAKAKLGSADFDFIDDSRSALMSASPRFARYTLFLMFGLVAATIYWASTNVVNVNTVGLGKVISSSNLQVIQNLEGGLVKEIFVREGERVKKGQVLIKLDDTRFDSDYKRDLAKQALAEIDIIRLTAESEGSETLNFPTELKKNYPDLIKFAKRLHEKNRASLQDNITQLRRSVKLVEQELEIVAPLAQRGAMSQLEKIRLERELNDLKTQIAQKIDEDRIQARNQLNKTRADLSLLKEQLSTSYDRLQRTQIRSPVDGIVNKMHISTIGEVIDSGEKMIEIVPLDNRLTIIIKVAPADIGFIKVGQNAIVKISAYDYAVYGNLKSHVVNIGSDTLSDSKGNDFYEVKLQTESNYLESNGRELPIRPGMAVTAYISTGQRTILSYIIKPFIDVRDSAFTRR